MIEHIHIKCYHARRLSVSIDKESGLLCRDWLGATQMENTQACATVLAEKMQDWLVVDHFALDAYLELAQAEHCGQLMVIDDLADRPHESYRARSNYKGIRESP